MKKLWMMGTIEMPGDDREHALHCVFAAGVRGNATARIPGVVVGIAVAGHAQAPGWRHGTTDTGKPFSTRSHVVASN